MTVLSGSIGRSFPPSVRARATLAAGPIRLPIRYLGNSRACRFHDRIVARWLERHAAEIELVHGWPLASLQTMRVAKRHGIPFLLERPNAHTAYAYQSTAEECRRLGIQLPTAHDHHFNRDFLDQEEKEYEMADYLLCPSHFVADTFKERGFAAGRLLHHHYGFDETRFQPGQQNAAEDRGLVMIHVGACEPRKGLHYALQAWLDSGAARRGTFIICGGFIPGYAEKLRTLLDHPSVQVLGHRNDIPELMQSSDLFVLSSVEEGSALVTYEAKGAGCVLMVSDGAGAVCKHGVDAMLHPMRDVDTLASQIRLLDQDRDLLRRLRTASIASSTTLRWENAGARLAEIYSTASKATSAASCACKP
jgi:glycosyltransferase involved in cell wall biosynthesis